MEDEPIARGRTEPKAGRPEAPPSYGFGKNSAQMLP